MLDSLETLERRYLGGIHVHSTYSYDGSLSLAELRHQALQRGLHFLCMTEHTDQLTEAEVEAFVQECKAHSDEQFVFVPGFEVPYQEAHVLMLGAETFVAQTADREKLKQWATRAELVVLAHPHRNRFLVDDVLASLLDGVEIWNSQYDGKQAPRIKSWELLDSLREKRLQAEPGSAGLLAFGGLDIHRSEHFGGPEIHLSLSELNTTGILEALKLGQYTIRRQTKQIEPQARVDSLTYRERALSRVNTQVMQLAKASTRGLKRLGIRVPKGVRTLIRKYL